MPKRVAVLQSNYLPWKGYFDIIHDVDEFIFRDDVQYTRQDWRNRNRIKTPGGPRWLTIPTGADDNRRICDVVLPGGSWPLDHWQRIEGNYRAAPYFERYRPILRTIYRDRSWNTLSELNQYLIATVAGELGLRTKFRDSRGLKLAGDRETRLIGIIRQVGGDIYVSGPAAQAYLDPRRFADAGIEVVWKSYDGYPEYAQLHPPFVHEVTILDLLFHTGPDAPRYIWGWRSTPQ